MSVMDDDVAALIASAEAFLAACTGTEVNAVAVTRWELELYRDTLVEHAPLASTARAFARDVDYSSDLLSDVFAYLWLSAPVLRERDQVAPTRWGNLYVLGAMSRSAEVRQLRTATVHDEVASAMAVVWLSESLREWLREESNAQDTRDERVAQALRRLLDAQQDEDFAEVAGAVYELEEALEEARSSADVPGMNEAARQAGMRLQDLSEMASVLGVSSTGDTHGEQRVPRAQVWQALARLRRSHVAHYAQLIGSFKAAVASGRQSSPSPRGVELSDRLADADAAELATRGHRLLRLEHLQRLADAELVTDSYTSAAAKAGPMILVMDESSSMMEGHPVSRLTWSKAFALAMVQQARAEHRRVIIIAFAGANQRKTWVDPDAMDLIDYLEHDFNGATDYEPALDQALIAAETCSPLGVTAGIVLVTDDDRPDVPGGWSTRWSARRAAMKPYPPKLRGVGVGVRSGVWLSGVCDDSVLIADFTDMAEVARAARRF